MSNPGVSTDERDVSQPQPLHTRARKVLGRIRRSFEVDVFDVFVREVPEQATLEAPSGYVYRWGTAEDVMGCDPYHTELDQNERQTGIARLDLGHRVVLALADDQVVFSMWVNPRNLNVPDLVKRRLREDQWFIYKAYTSPDHRGKSLYKAGLQFVLEAMRAEGLRELVGYAHVKKAVSRMGLARLSFGSIGRITQLRVPGVTRTFLSKPLVAAFPETVARSSAPATHPSS